MKSNQGKIGDVIPTHLIVKLSDEAIGRLFFQLMGSFRFYAQRGELPQNVLDLLQREIAETSITARIGGERRHWKNSEAQEAIKAELAGDPERATALWLASTCAIEDIANK